MTCEVPHLRLTDGHAWTHKPLFTREYEEKDQEDCPPDLPQNLSTREISRIYCVPLPTAARWYRDSHRGEKRFETAVRLYKECKDMRLVAAAMHISYHTVRAMIYKNSKALAKKTKKV